jgi:hypothetical protein
VLEIGQLMDARILANQQIVLVAEVPGKIRVLIALVVCNARKTEIERARFDEFPDARARHQAHADLAAAAARQCVGEVLVDARVRVDRVKQPMIV